MNCEEHQELKLPPIPIINSLMAVIVISVRRPLINKHQQFLIRILLFIHAFTVSLKYQRSRHDNASTESSLTRVTTLSTTYYSSSKSKSQLSTMYVIQVFLFSNGCFFYYIDPFSFLFPNDVVVV